MLRSFFQLLSRANQLIRSKSSNGKSGLKKAVQFSLVEISEFGKMAHNNSADAGIGGAPSHILHSITSNTSTGERGA
jgi:hypothetical protein